MISSPSPGFNIPLSSPGDFVFGGALCGTAVTIPPVTLYSLSPFATSHATAWPKAFTGVSSSRASCDDIPIDQGRGSRQTGFQSRPAAQAKPSRWFTGDLNPIWFRCMLRTHKRMQTNRLPAEGSKTEGSYPAAVTDPAVAALLAGSAPAPILGRNQSAPPAIGG